MKESKFQEKELGIYTSNEPSLQYIFIYYQYMLQKWSLSVKGFRCDASMRPSGTTPRILTYAQYFTYGHMENCSKDNNLKLIALLFDNCFMKATRWIHSILLHFGYTVYEYCKKILIQNLFNKIEYHYCYIIWSIHMIWLYSICMMNMSKHHYCYIIWSLWYWYICICMMGITHIIIIVPIQIYSLRYNISLDLKWKQTSFFILHDQFNKMFQNDTVSFNSI